MPIVVENRRKKPATITKGWPGAAVLDGAVDVRALTFYADRQSVVTAWVCVDQNDVPGMGFSHPRFQEAAFAWAALQGAVTPRPAKVLLTASQSISSRTKAAICIPYEDGIGSKTPSSLSRSAPSA